MAWKERYIRMAQMQRRFGTLFACLIFLPVFLSFEFLGTFFGLFAFMGMADAYRPSAIEAWFRPIMPRITWWPPYGFFLELLLVFFLVPWLLAEAIYRFKRAVGGPVPLPAMRLNAWQRLESKHPLWMLPRYLLTLCLYLVGVYLLTHLNLVRAFLHLSH